MRNEEIQKTDAQVFMSDDARQVVVFKYPTLEAFIESANLCPAEYHARDSMNAVWYGANTFEDAAQIARHGMDVNHEAIHLQAFETFHNQTTEIVEDVVGGAVNIGNFLEGIPENMFDFRMVDNVKFIDVALVVTENARVRPSQLNHKAMGTAWLVDKLENSGYRVRLSALFATVDLDGRNNELVKITVKDYHEPLAIGQISGACSASFFRRIEFRHMERFFRIAPNRGHVYNGARLHHDLKHLFNPGDEVILLDNLTTFDRFDLKTPRSALQWAEHFSNHKITIQ